MTNPPYGNTPGGHWPPAGPPVGPPPAWPAAAAPKQTRAPMLVALALALIAVAVSIGAWFRPAAEAPPPTASDTQFTDEQITDAKTSVCDAFGKAKKAIAGAATQSSTDPTVTFVIAVNTRLATQLSARFITDTLKENPATPAELSKSVRGMASAWNNIVLAQLSGTGTDDPTLKPVLAQLDSSDAEISQACK